MIELRKDQLHIRFPELHPQARMSIDFQRTLRIPDDGKDYPLPAGLGRFPLRHVDDFGPDVPERWLEHGGVMLPMYQSEALWINFAGGYPFAVKIAAGKIDAVTGKTWSNSLHRHPQNYVTVPEQPWLDGYCVAKGVIRQFVAMPLGSGYSAEEQLTGEAEHGGLQIVAYPLKRDVYEEWAAKRQAVFSKSFTPMLAMRCTGVPDMGLAPGGRMRQEIYDDPFKLTDWDPEHAARCFVHIANSQVWRAITGEAPPTVPLTAREYKRNGIPWFEYYSDGKAVEGSGVLDRLKSIAQFATGQRDEPLSDNDSVEIDRIVVLRQGLEKGQVREGRF
ncbi:MAG: hypothetical protein AMS18_12450 [Gemmatimonas sp. SG8_17]|nr:MAG: hypothetical protein AMS18_12450 [Gemmatimonas sp. SG8_17]